MQQVLKTPGSGVDFHMHTLASDGDWTPERLVETAATNGLRVMTVSDHDTTSATDKVRVLAQARGIAFIPGVEVTVNVNGLIYHVLMLNYDQYNAPFQAMLAETRQGEEDKRQGMIAELTKRGYKIEGLDRFRRPDGHFLNSDIARAMVKGGKVKNFEYALHLCEQVGMYQFLSQPADRALSLGLAAGAVPVLAHPGRSGNEFTPATTATLDALREMGIQGIECYHYSHGPAEVERYSQYARQHDLAISCGSDSHNENRAPMPWNPELCRSLLERLSINVPTAQAA